MSEKEIIYDLLKEVRADQGVIKDDISEIKTTLVINTKDLAEHMAQTKLLKEMWVNHHDRLEVLEEPHKINKAFYKKLKKYKKVVALATAVLGLIAAWLKFRS